MNNRESFNTKNLKRNWRQNFPFPRWDKHSILLKCEGKKTKILDVGCGNNSPYQTKLFCNDCYYVGVDVQDYNQAIDSKTIADEYHLFDTANFSISIDTLPSDFDLVISTHNIEHCNDPKSVLCAMCRRLSERGRLYMVFPCADSVNFPHRKGTLNFYDDPTHVYIPNMEEILDVLKQNRMRIIKSIKNYKPIINWCRGLLEEPLSIFTKTRKTHTWALYGFESIIVAERN